jgi:transposase
VEVYVIQPSSVPVDRRLRRAKSDFYVACAIAAARSLIEASSDGRSVS